MRLAVRVELRVAFRVAGLARMGVRVFPRKMGLGNMRGFRFSPFCEVASGLIDVRSVRQGGLDLLTLSSSHFDPNRN
jgi:hypothetical protein